MDASFVGRLRTVREHAVMTTLRIIGTCSAMTHRMRTSPDQRSVAVTSSKGVTQLASSVWNQKRTILEIPRGEVEDHETVDVGGLHECALSAKELGEFALVVATRNRTLR